MRHQFKKADFARRQVFTSDARMGITFKQAQAPKPGSAAEEAAEWGATLAGYCIVWGATSSDRGGYQVRIAKGAVSFATPTIGTWNHDFSRPLGNTVNGSLRLMTDEIGVRFEMDLPDTTTGRDAAELVGDRYVNGCSFTVEELLEFTENTEGDTTIVTFTKCIVSEVCPTAIPAFAETQIGLQDDAEEPAETPAADNNGYSKQLAADAARLDRLKLAMYRL